MKHAFFISILALSMSLSAFASDDGCKRTMPFGERVRSYANTDKQGTRVGTTLSDKINDSASYQVRADHDDVNRLTNVAASASLLPRYARLNVGYNRSSQGNTSYNGRLSGAVVTHGNGVTLSPYPVDDTFGVVSVGDLLGIKIMTPRGPDWTDMFGQPLRRVLRPIATANCPSATRRCPVTSI
ncbi:MULTISPECIES: fimbria/pilus outer membrane usher protein [unclassified Pseudomonas]|uniref:fimbria/pilus outer membrane usher protein n=1 Tax=unclassified Pseudomonas TaxID=196821 RepID=UPI000C86AB97|nr:MULTISPECIES: fimbria/pilus outer membrane usher protein [unclassified Pseudomonas]PMV25220.1 hypothetical protein C1X17_05730 [Pseudomonas sp. FW305-3-2-15-C-TSA2]PMV28942.1 hypothetical protein C1X22_12230 [Pseudomonas sp. DP16D-L5]PMV38937.1 hypothetical protein C1X21_12345 [Pseudomonas sp. FW305-3-2-15-A-LB2]PMV40972.1 hypothetical protein C1X16_25000 [Pseudomonas sp. FW305-3-2-15-C-R2A1]PMV50116.1 hypothetical protein C1X19_26885 [Pseudomonas sp. GW460-4]